MLKSLVLPYNTETEKPSLYLLPDPKPVKCYPTPAMFLMAEEKNEAISNFDFITPVDFVQRWNIPQQKLTQITGSGLSVVKSWFDRRKVSPSFEASYRLTKINEVWSRKYNKNFRNLDVEPSKVMYDVVKIVNKKISTGLIDLPQFCSEWYCNFSDLVFLTTASPATIRKWFLGKKMEFKYSYRLTSVHKEWRKIQNEHG